jgi:Flp pilus assembly protein TadG
MIATAYLGRTHHRRQRGVVAVAFILLFSLLLGFAGLAVDAGRLYISKTELQNSADSCALAAAGALTGVSANQLIAAEDFGIAAGTRNLVGMQAVAVTIGRDRDIAFSDALDGAYQTRSAVGNPTQMRFARCTLTEAGIPTILLQVISGISGQGTGPSTIRASAIASLAHGPTACPLPIPVCSSGFAGKSVGDWILVQNQPWVAFSEHDQNRDLEALLTGSGQCGVRPTESVRASGERDSILQAWNTRFGIYRPGGPAYADARPDRTGWVYDPTLFPARFNAFPDYRDKVESSDPTRQRHQRNADYRLRNPNRWAADEQFDAGTKYRRLVTAPIVDCGELVHQPTRIQGFACILMLNPAFRPGDPIWLEYRGSADDPLSGCVTIGAPGGPAATGPGRPTLVQ